MSVTLKMADGDLFINPETGRSEIISGPSKVDQELAELYLTDYDSYRNWGSELGMESFVGQLLPAQLQSMLYLRVSQANNRILLKQDNDPTLSPEEMITGFSRVDVDQDLANAAGYFLVAAEVGDNVVFQTVKVDYRPTSLRHIIPPPTLLPKQVSGAQVVVADNNWTVLYTPTFADAQPFADGTAWEFAKQKSVWDSYPNSKFYFLLSKTKNIQTDPRWYKIALQVGDGKVWWDALGDTHFGLAFSVPSFNA